MIKSKVRIMGVCPDPIRIKGLTKPLTLHWDGVGGKFQLMILTALTDVGRCAWHGRPQSV